MTLQVNRLMEKAESRLLVNLQSVSVHLVLFDVLLENTQTNQTQDKQNKATVTVLTAKNLMRNGTKKSGYY